MTDASDAVRRLYEAYEASDDQALLAALDPDVEWYMPDTLPYGGRFRGPSEVRRYFEGLPEHVERGAVDSLRTFTVRNHVFVLGIWRSRTAAGVPFETPFVNAFEVRAGKILRFDAYPDTARILRALSI